MGEFREVFKIDELKDGTMKTLTVAGHEILLARVGDKYYAAGTRCTHMGGNLAQGKLEGTVVTCPRHGSQFDLESGVVVRWLRGAGLLSRIGKALKSPRPLAIYRVKIENDRVMIEI